MDFFLDADEYLPFKNRKALTENLSAYKRHPVISINWCNLIPSEYDHDRTTPLNERTFFVPSSNSKFNKIALRPTKIDLGKVWVCQGNHLLQSQEGGSEIPSEPANFRLFHIPIRSQAQFSEKLNQGISGLNAYASISRFMSQHWRQLRDYLDNTEISDKHINAIIASYGEKINRNSCYSHDELTELGYERQNLHLAQLPIPCQFVRREKLHPMDKTPVSSFSGPLSISALTIDEAGNISVDVEKNTIANANRDPKPYSSAIWQRLRRLIRDFVRLRFPMRLLGLTRRRSNSRAPIRDVSDCDPLP